jgi:hypothetical protein
MVRRINEPKPDFLHAWEAGRETRNDGVCMREMI